MPKAKQLTLWVADQPGILGEIASALGAKKTNIVALMGATEAGRGAVRMVVDKPATARKVFAAAKVPFGSLFADRFALLLTDHSITDHFMTGGLCCLENEKGG